MSYDLCVFDVERAPKNTKEFFEWYMKKVEWSEDRDYDSTEGTTQPLVNFYNTIIKKFPPMNGPLAPRNNNVEIDKEAYITDYSIDSELIYMSFSWEVSGDAMDAVSEEAEKYGLVFFDLQGGDDIFLPDGSKME